MGRSSLQSDSLAVRGTKGLDTSLLGPSDGSDNGSDRAGLGGPGTGDPALPVDVAMRENARGLPGGDSLSSGAADIGVDRVFVPGDADEADERVLSDDEDPDLAFIDDIQAEDLLTEEDKPDPQDRQPGQDEQQGAAQRLAASRAVESGDVLPPASPDAMDDTDAAGRRIPALLRPRPHRGG